MHRYLATVAQDLFGILLPRPRRPSAAVAASHRINHKLSLQSLHLLSLLPMLWEKFRLHPAEAVHLFRWLYSWKRYSFDSVLLLLVSWQPACTRFAADQPLLLTAYPCIARTGCTLRWLCDLCTRCCNLTSIRHGLCFNATASVGLAFTQLLHTC